MNNIKSVIYQHVEEIHLKAQKPRKRIVEFPRSTEKHSDTVLTKARVKDTVLYVSKWFLPWNIHSKPGHICHSYPNIHSNPPQQKQQTNSSTQKQTYKYKPTMKTNCY